MAVGRAFEVPGLRNVEVHGPHFHNGGMVSLEQAVAFYDRRGDFSSRCVHVQLTDSSARRARQTSRSP